MAVLFVEGIRKWLEKYISLSISFSRIPYKYPQPTRTVDQTMTD
jgi:hypothetical protein